MKYDSIEYGRFIRKINRFEAEVVINGDNELVHIKNTGRLKELLKEDTKIILERSNNKKRKTKYSIIAVSKNDRLVNIDSLATNHVAYEALIAQKILEIGKIDILKKEVTYRDSRFDLYFENSEHKGFIEVKGVTLEDNGIAMFPDAPTARGTKHVLEMIKAVENGFIGIILFIVQMKGCHAFAPNHNMDLKFSDALLNAYQKGVKILVYDTIITEDSISLDKRLPTSLM